MQRIDGYVLDAISFDADQLDAIVTFLNEPDSEWRSCFERVAQRPEVLASLMRLVKHRLVSVHVLDAEGNDFVELDEGVWPDRPITDLYFDLTGRGRVRYLNWDL